MYKLKIVLLLLTTLLFTSCRTYHFTLTDPDTDKKVEFKMTHSLSDTELGSATFTKNADGLWEVTIENLHTEQKLADAVRTLATALAAAGSVAAPVP